MSTTHRIKILTRTVAPKAAEPSRRPPGTDQQLAEARKEHDLLCALSALHV